MSDQKIESIVDNYYSILQFFKDNPDVLEKWKNIGMGPGTTEPNTNSITRGTNSNDSSKRDLV